MYLHWMNKNTNNYMNGTQGEMNAMTLGEQIVSRPAVVLHSCDKKKAAASVERKRAKTCALTASVLCVIPTLLAHVACNFAEYDNRLVFANVAVWLAVLVLGPRYCL